MTTRQSIKVRSGALDEFEGEIILRGVLDPDSFPTLKVGDYQREIGSRASIASLSEAFVTGSVPDIELGVRGGGFTERDGCFYVHDDVYIVDGLQRVTAAQHLIQKGGSKPPRLGATFHFNTTEKWERERFRILNAERKSVSSNVLIRNMRQEYPVVETLYSLTHDKAFVLGDRVCWNQWQNRQQLITAMTLISVIGRLHSHLGPGRSRNRSDLVRGLQTIMDKVGKNTFRDNVRAYFDLLDECWGIRRIAFREGAVYMRSNFMETLALFLSKHQAFWRENRLFVERDLKKKIAQFPLTDPNVANLASASGKAGDILYQLLLDHVNSGKRTRRLHPRRAA